VEQATLRPLPGTPYDLAVWKQVLLHRDCYVCFAQSYYSAPFRLVRQALWVRGGARTVELYTADHQLVATHTRAQHPGERHTHLDHLPPEKVPGLMLTREGCRAQAQGIGPATTALVDALLDERPVDRLRVAGRVLRLAQMCSAPRLERACARAAQFGASDYLTVKRILREGLDQVDQVDQVVQVVHDQRDVLAPAVATAGAPGAAVGTGPLARPVQPPLGALPPAPDGRYAFVRQASEFVAGLFGGTSGVSASNGALGGSQ